MLLFCFLVEHKTLQIFYAWQLSILGSIKWLLSAHKVFKVDTQLYAVDQTAVQLQHALLLLCPHDTEWVCYTTHLFIQGERHISINW